MKNNALVEIIVGAAVITGGLYLFCVLAGKCNAQPGSDDDDITGLPAKGDGITPVKRITVQVQNQEDCIFPEEMLQYYPQNEPTWPKLT